MTTNAAEYQAFISYIEENYGHSLGITIVSCPKFLSLNNSAFNNGLPLLIYDIESDFKKSVYDKLTDIYGKSFEHAVFDGIKARMADTLNLDDATMVYIKEFDINNASKMSFSMLIDIMNRLRAKDGCPWDKEQTHSSIRGCLIEEAYELLEAIELNSKEKMLEECGDVLLQSIFHAVIAEENNEFSVNDTINALCYKLYSRHTHIFGENKANDSKEALKFWDAAKSKEKSQFSVTDKVNSIPETFTALLRAEKTQKYIKKSGFDIPNLEYAVGKLNEEIGELLSAPKEKQEDEGGDVLFAAVNVLRLMGINPEIALNGTTNKFKKRFEFVEKMAKENNKPLDECTLDQMEEWYNMYKCKYENR